jgi:hypothetical protein
MSAKQPQKKEISEALFEPLQIHNRERVPVIDSSEQNVNIELTNIMTKSMAATTALSNQNFYYPAITTAISPIQPKSYTIVLITSPQNYPFSESRNEIGNTFNGNKPLQSGRKLIINKFSVGISFTEKNTWLLSKETFDGLDKKNLNKTEAKFLNDFGILLRYNLDERWSLEGNIFLKSKTGQSYRQYLNGLYGTKTYELRYLSFELSARYFLHKFRNINNLKSYSITGAYISHLSSAYEDINKSQYDISTHYNPIDYGVLIGYEIEILILNRFAITPGFRIKCGIPNIYADRTGIPDGLYTTRNASLEFRLNLILPLTNF